MTVDWEWERVEALFGAAKDLSAPERKAYLDESGASEADRREVERLLGLHDAEGSFLDSPIMPRGDTEVMPEGEIPEPADAGQIIGSYELRRMIGEGGMGAVYLAAIVSVVTWLSLVSLPR